MPRRHPARLVIHRLDCPAAPMPYAAVWRIEGRSYRVGVWTDTQWYRIPERDRPDDARRLTAGGWLVVRPFTEPSETTAVPGAWPTTDWPRPDWST
jgi:hypothetical protein